MSCGNAITVASAVVKGGYEQLTPVNQAIATWVTDNNYDFNGAMFCIYHVSPGHDSNSENWVTEICYPVKKK
jgi:effector-binding domain-containing protein